MADGSSPISVWGKVTPSFMPILLRWAPYPGLFLIQPKGWAVAPQLGERSLLSSMISAQAPLAPAPGPSPGLPPKWGERVLPGGRVGLSEPPFPPDWGKGAGEGGAPGDRGP